MTSTFAVKKALPGSTGADLNVTGNSKLTGGSAISELDLEDVVVALETIRSGSGQEESVVNTVLEIASRYTDPPTLRSSTVKWLERMKKEDSVDNIRISDGIGDAKGANKPEAMTKVKMYDSNYKPTISVQQLPEDIKTWCTPTGLIWSSESVDDMAGDTKILQQHNSGGLSPEALVPISLYTLSQIGKHTFWAVWSSSPDDYSAGCWKVIRSEELEANFDPDSGRALLDPSWFSHTGVPAAAIPKSINLGIQNNLFNDDDAIIDFRISSCKTSCQIPNQNTFSICRYRSTASCKGNVRYSPLYDTVAWIPSFNNQKNELEIPMAELPPSGVLEYIGARPAEEIIDWPAEYGWTCHPWFKGEATTLLIARCFNVDDQQIYDETIHNQFLELLRVVVGGEGAKVIKSTIEDLQHWAKEQKRYVPDVETMMSELDGCLKLPQEFIKLKLCEEIDSPPPGSIAHCLEAQLLEWNQSRFVVSISGLNPIIGILPSNDSSSTMKICRLSRVNNTISDQLYWHVNYAMRCKQDNTDAQITISGDGFPSEVKGNYKPPTQAINSGVEAVDWKDDWDGQDTDADSCGAARNSIAVFTHSEDASKTLYYDGVSWMFSGTSTYQIPNHAISLRLGYWCLPQSIPLIFHLTKGLEQVRKIPGHSPAPVALSYRGFKGSLPPHLYEQSKVVLWTAFASSSVDREIAAQFTQGRDPKAAVITIRGNSCVNVSKWSRFAREREWLYGANSMFQVASTLSEDSAKILGLENLQLFTLEEVSEVQALLIYLRGLVNIVVATGEGSVMPRYVEQIFRAMDALGRKELTETLRICCQLEEPMIQSTECRDITTMLLRMGADEGAFGEIAMQLEIVDPKKLMSLVRAGASFDVAQNCFEHFEVRERRLNEIFSFITQDEIQSRGLSEREEVALRVELSHTINDQFDLLISRIPRIRVTGMPPGKLHLNGVYQLDPPQELKIPSQILQQGLHGDGLQCTVDETRPWGCFIVTVKQNGIASLIGLRPEMRIVGASVGEEYKEITGILSWESLVGELIKTTETISLYVEVRTRYSQVDPTRFQCCCYIKLDERNEWRCLDTEMEEQEEEQREHWEEWLPVGAQLRTKVTSVAPVPSAWLLGQWRQRDELSHYWMIKDEKINKFKDAQTIEMSRKQLLLTHARDEVAEIIDLSGGVSESLIKQIISIQQPKEVPDGCTLKLSFRNIEDPDENELCLVVGDDHLDLHRAVRDGIYPFITAESVDQCRCVGNLVPFPVESIVDPLETASKRALKTFIISKPPSSLSTIAYNFGTSGRWGNRSGGSFNTTTNRLFNIMRPLESITTPMVDRGRVQGTDPQTGEIHFGILISAQEGIVAKRSFSLSNDGETTEDLEKDFVKLINIHPFFYDWSYSHHSKDFKRKRPSRLFDKDVNRKCYLIWHKTQLQSADQFASLLRSDSDSDIQKIAKERFKTVERVNEWGIASVLETAKWVQHERDEFVKKAVSMSTPTRRTSKSTGILSGNTTSCGLVTIHVGQCGVQIADTLWDRYTRDHNIIDGMSDEVPSQLLFDELSSGRYAPRAILVDTDPMTIENSMTGVCRNVFSLSNFRKGNNCAADLFTRGRYGVGRDSMKFLIPSLRRQAEACETVSGFHLIHSNAGGTGSGLASLISDELRDNFKSPTHHFTVMPGKFSSSVGAYNSVLSLPYIANSSLTTVFDNSVLYQICEKKMGLRQATFNNINHLISQVIGNVTASMRFPRDVGSLRCDLVDSCTNLVPYPSLSFTCPHLFPILPSKDLERPRVLEVVGEGINPNNCMIPMGSTPESNKRLSSAMYLRGNMTHFKIISAAAAVRQSRTMLDADFSLSTKISLCLKPPVHCPGSGTSSVPRNISYLLNSPSICRYFERTFISAFDLLFAKRAFCHWMDCEDDEFIAARERCESIIKDYSEVAYPPEEESEEGDYY